VSEPFHVPTIDALLDGSKAAWEEKMSKRFAVVDASSASGDSSGEGNAN
jgi:hypothetical protein